MSVILDVDGVVKQFEGHLAVDHVSFQVAPGRILGLLGPNGAGKTTTIRMVMDIIAPDAGTVRLFGRPRDDDTNSRIGYLPEERGLYRRMTVTDQLVFLAEIRGLRRPVALPRIREWLQRMDLTDWAHRKVEELSKGMQQKVQFIGTVISAPPLLILDEPFSGLDPNNTILLQTFLREARDEGKAIIFSTHVLEQAEKLCDDICLIKGGRKILDGPLSEIRQRFRRPEFLVRGSGIERLVELEEVQAVMPDQENRDGERFLVELHREEDMHDFLRRALTVAELTEFRPHEPDLIGIFRQAVDAAGETLDEMEVLDMRPGAAAPGGGS